MKPLIIGVTGGIGSGKSAVTARFAERCVPVFDADIIARELVAPGEPALAEIAQTFGTHLIDAQGQLDRAALRAVVFADAAARTRLNNILHPRIHQRLHTLAHTPGPAFVLLAIPLLTESGHRYDWLDRVLVVDVPREVQIQRTMQRDGSDRASAERMLNTQATRQQRLARANDIICNDGPIDLLDGMVERLYGFYREWVMGNGASRG